jgi:hypothetical protein
VIGDRWSVVRGPWSVVRGPWSVVRGPWSVVREGWNESVAASPVAFAGPRQGFVGRSVDRIAAFLKSRPPRSRVTWTRSERVDPASLSFGAVRRRSGNNVGPVTMSHPDSWDRCGRAPQAPSAKATVHRTNRHGCGRRRRRSTRIPHVRCAHRVVFLDWCRDADGARRRRRSSLDHR